jgi:hypothetical protein
MGRWRDIAGGGATEFIAPDPDSTDWWIFGRSHSEYRDLADAVTAAVHNSYATVQQTVEARPTELYGVQGDALPPLIGRIRITPGELPQTEERLRLLADLWTRRPLAAREPPRTTARLLRDLDEALANGRLSDAEVVVDDLRRAGRLTALNLDFLEIRIAASAGRWPDVLSRPDVDDIARTRLPWRVAAILIEAVYHVHLAERVKESPKQIVGHFRDLVEPHLGPAFRDPTRAITAAERVAWIVYAAAIEPPSAAIRDVILAQTRADAAERSIVEAVAALAVEPAQPAPVETRVEQLLEAGDLAGAWDAVRQGMPHGATRARALLHIAFEADSPTWAEAAVREANELLVEDRDALDGRTTRTHLSALSALLSGEGRAIASWKEWMNALASSDSPERLVEIARDHGTWPVESLLLDAESPALLLGIATGDDRRAAALRQSRPLFLPQLLDAFDDEDGVPGTAVGLLAVLAEAIASEERIGRYELVALLEIAERVLQHGATEADYTAVVGRGLRAAWTRGGSARELGWLADAVLAVARGPNRFAEPREGFLQAAVATVASYPTLYEEDREAVAEAFSFAGIDLAGVLPTEPVSAVDEASIWLPLRGRKTVIYTLIEAAGSRAKAFLLERVPEADIEVRSDATADRRLVEHVRRADLLVVATRAAKHAATLEIERQRRPDAIIVYPTGKGWSSIVGAVREVCRAL